MYCIICLRAASKNSYQSNCNSRSNGLSEQMVTCTPPPPPPLSQQQNGIKIKTSGGRSARRTNSYPTISPPPPPQKSRCTSSYRLRGRASSSPSKSAHDTIDHFHLSSSISAFSNIHRDSKVIMPLYPKCCV